MNFSRNNIFNLKYVELNRLLVGSGLISLNIELQKDDRTVCCGHTDMEYSSRVQSYSVVVECIDTVY